MIVGSLLSSLIIKYSSHFKWISIVSYIRKYQIKYRNLSNNGCGYL